ncbi:protein MAIN-LIKE 2-like [Gastrolobium bilobum]|uniref:protein MAIN-LIKE 2-like n=1 Tax=Gastrolobium bilobum TaxID=150636 RepID=UPI002AAFA6BE|nr:protein MAIN-LIKE 2-like [Gastrolobium bilobum]
MADSSSSSGSASDPEPTDPSILNSRRGKPQRGSPTDAIPEVVTDYLTQVGFIHVARMRHIQIDAPLISAMVEKWRPETHTFHMTQSEMTITLQDVARILGLPTDGIVVTGSTSEDWPAVCAAVFGAVPLASEFHHSGDLRISFLDRLYTRWISLGCWLLADKSGGSNIGCRLVPLLGVGFDEIGCFCWGSAVLAHLFRNLCECTDAGRSDMGGCHILFQIWAWIRFPPIAPPLPLHQEPGTHYGCRFNTVAKFKPHEVVHYRETLDTICRDEVVWQP